MMYRASVKFRGIFGVVFLLQNLHLAVSQDCTLPEELWGNWTSTNLGTIVITGSSPSLTFTQTFTGQNVSVNEMDCRFISGTQYILESKSDIHTFSNTAPIFMLMCLDLRRASAYSYYYYLNSPVEVGFDGYRLIGLPDTANTVVSDVCTTTLATAEFQTMIKVGHETDAVNAVQCADAVLGLYSYTYTDSTGTYCENANASFISACDSADKTHIIVNNSDCTNVDPFYSNDGRLGCIANVYNSGTDVYYISLYNLDSPPTTQFICTAVTKATNGTVFLSMNQASCESDQTPTTLPSGGATMVLTASCLDSESRKRNWIWLYILVPCIVVLIIVVILSLCLYFWLKKRETRRARKQEPLVHGDHPLGEVSLKLDAPASLGLQHGYIDRKRDLLEKPARRRLSEDRQDLFGEQSLDLNLETETWKQLERGKRPPIIKNGFSGAIVNGSMSNGSSHKLDESSRIGGRFKSKAKNFLAARMVSNNLKTRTKSRNPKSYERSTTASSSRGPILKMKNGVHPGPPLKSTRSIAGSRAGSRAESRAVSGPASRAVSRSGSRRGSIDNLVTSRSSRNYGMPRSKTMVLTKPKEEKKPDIYTMPEEYVTEGGPNEVMPSRPVPATNNILRDPLQSFNRRSFAHSSLMKPGASKKPWH